MSHEIKCDLERASITKVFGDISADGELYHYTRTEMLDDKLLYECGSYSIARAPILATCTVRARKRLRILP